MARLEDRLENSLSPLGGTPITRRTALLLLVGIGLATLSACQRSADSPAAKPTPSEEYPLQEDGEALVDPKLGVVNHPFLYSIKFSFDAPRSGGSLKMETGIKIPTELRLITEEIKPAPGIIFCEPRSLQPGSHTYYPVIRYEVGDQELVYLGFRYSNQACLEGYTNMRAYLITRTSGLKLEGKFVGLKTLDPDQLKPRDKEAEGYFKPNCST